MLLAVLVVILLVSTTATAYLFTAERPDHTLAYHFAVENPQGISAMALAVILQDTLSGAPLEQVAQVPGEIVYDLFGRDLSMGKSMGLMGMVNMVTATARHAARTASP